MESRRTDRKRFWRFLALAYCVALLLSYGWRLGHPARLETRLSRHRIEDPLEGELEIALRETGNTDAHRPTILLIHGSPGDSGNFAPMLSHADPDLHWMAVDLPGFGESATRLGDYSVAAHARHLELLLEEMQIERAHLVGFSLGGGVALELHARAPERVASITLLSSIGVQELELLGDYRLNHLLHGGQLLLVQLLREGIPHFGAIDPYGIVRAFARNFYDSDQRPLRGMLSRLELPTLIVHGESDPLVPLAAAREHHRIVPQSELRLFPEGHFLPWQHSDELSALVGDFARRVEAGQAATRRQASAERLERAGLDFLSLPQSPATGLIWLTLIALLVAGTFVAEDLTCLSAGILIAQGRLDFASGLAACAGGIFFGDLWLYFAGRLLGERVLRLPLLRPVLSASRLHRAERWFARRGLLVILLTRFVPGARLPVYVAAGVLRTNFWRFALYFLIAVVLWTPLIVGLASRLGASALARLEHMRYAGTLVVVAAWLLLILLFGAVLPALSHRGRRRLIGRARALRRWEFWPAPVIYALLAPHIVWLAMRHGGLRGVTAINPGIANGGLLGESKAEILEQLDPASGAVIPWTLIPSALDPEGRRERLREWMRAEALQLPIVLKPDVGERGRGVCILGEQNELERVLEEADEDLIAQAHVAGEEFGVFVLRDPRSGELQIFSLNSKRLPVVVGDGARNLRDLILDDERAVILADVYLEAQAGQLDRVPAAGERIRLVELGTHCRGAIFEDARALASPALAARLAAALRGFDGFCLGRFDLKAPSREALSRGAELAILELNGLSSEAAHIYDPSIPLAEGLRTLRRQWSYAFEFAQAQRAQGHRPASWSELLPLLWRRLFGA